MSEHKGKVTMKGNPLTVQGSELKVGDKAPDATMVDQGMQEVSLKDVLGKVLVVSAVPSLDTPVCDVETKRFNKEADGLGEGVEVLTVSMDLPFAQKRWCGAEGVDKVKVLSDHKYASFGQEFGVLIKELRLLARVVFVVDAEGVIRHIEWVKEVGDEPDYDRILSEAKKLL